MIDPISTLYHELRKTSATAIIGFNSFVLDQISALDFPETEVDKELLSVSRQLSEILWNWQVQKPDYLPLYKIPTKEECRQFVSFKVYEYIGDIVGKAYSLPKNTVRNTFCGVLYDICLFCSWLLDGLERAYLKEKPNVFDSDIFDVKIEFLEDIISKTVKIENNLRETMSKAIEYLVSENPNFKEGIRSKSVSKSGLYQALT